MLKFGRYQIGFGGTFLVQTKVTMTVRRFLCFWILREVNPLDIDRKQQFPLGATMVHDGIVYHYMKAGSDIKIGGKNDESGGA